MKCISLLLFSMIPSNSLFASTGEIYGFGSRSQSMANTSLSSGIDSTAVYYNPAALSSTPGFKFDYGMSYFHPQFLEINNVVVSNSSTTATGQTKGSVDTEGYLDHFSQAISFSYTFLESFKNFSIGMLGSMPIARLAYMDTGDPFKPEYYNYRAQTQRPEFYVGSSVKPWKFLSLGLGLAYNANIASGANYTLSASNGTVSYGRVNTTVKPSVSPYFSVSSENDSFNVASTFRMASKTKMELEVTSNTRVLSSSSDFPIMYNSASTVYSSPPELDLGFSQKIYSNWWVTAEADWLGYSHSDPPSLSVTDTGSSIQLRNSITTKPELQDIIVYKIGGEYEITPSWKLRAGFSHRPMPLKDSSLAGNYVDPAKNVYSAGAGFDLHQAGFTKSSLTLNIHTQYHHLIRQTIKKSDGTEAGTTGQSKIGSPEYDIGGKIFGGGISISMLF